MQIKDIKLLHEVEWSLPRGSSASIPVRCIITDTDDAVTEAEATVIVGGNMAKCSISVKAVLPDYYAGNETKLIFDLVYKAQGGVPDENAVKSIAPSNLTCIIKNIVIA